MTLAQLDAAYDNRAHVGDWRAILRRWARASEQIYTTRRVTRDVPYGPHERQTMDVFPADTPGRPTLVYFHGGYWQWLDKHEEAFVAEGPLSAGFNVVLCGYRLCPSVTLADIMQDVHLAVDVIGRGLDHHDAQRGALIVAGSSAGAHLAATLLGRGDVQGGLLISGIYDLAPLAASSMNRILQLDRAVGGLSPIDGIPSIGPPVCFAVGSRELPEMRLQTRAYHDAWRERQLPGWLETIEDADHFTILDHLAAPAGILVSALERLSCEI